MPPLSCLFRSCLLISYPNQTSCVCCGTRFCEAEASSELHGTTVYQPRGYEDAETRCISSSSVLFVRERSTLVLGIVLRL